MKNKIWKKDIYNTPSNEAGDTGVETSWKTLQITNEWVRHFDTKGAITLTFLGVLINFLFNLTKDLKNINCIHTIFIIAIVLSLIIGTISCLKTLVPRIKNGHPAGRSLIFFGDIASTRDNVSNYANQLVEISKNKELLIHEIAQQIYQNSKIANKKSEYSRIAILASILSAILIFLLAVTIELNLIH